MSVVSPASSVTSPTLTWPHLITSLLAGRDLSRGEAAWAMEQVMTDEVLPVQLTGFLVALRAKGETVDEVTGLAEVMLRHAVRIEVPGPALDIVGTGGDRSHSVNISTMASIVAAGAGYRVVKHGNRAASSQTGAADVLQALGVRLDLPVDRVAELAVEVGITFCFAQVFHPSFRFAGPVRRDLGIPTAFNLLGPLTNPAQPGVAAIGCADLQRAPIIAGVLAARGDSALVFRGENGLDELSTTAPSQVWQVADGEVTALRLDAADVGLPPATLEDLRGGDAAHNADVVRSMLAGTPGPIRDAVLLNAAAALVAAGVGAGDLVARIAAALELVSQAVDSGAAASTLDNWIKASAS